MRGAIFVLCLMALSSWSALARAHEQARSYCTVRTVVGGLDVTMESAAHLLRQPLGLGERMPTDAELVAAEARLTQQLIDRVQARTPSGACRARAEKPELSSRDGERSVRTKLHFDCPPGPVTLRNSFRLDVDPLSETMCAVDGSAWVFRFGIEELEVGTPPTLGATLGSFVWLGALHVFGGIDHVLFVVALLLAAALAGADKSLRAGVLAVAGVVTGFTVGHSITLILAGLDLVRVSPRITESVIALSIVVVALENVLAREIRWRVWTAAIFGLVHGFGFASVLAETELPARGAVPALLAFNGGIELAQLAIVLVLYPALAWSARRAWYRKRILVPASLVIALLAAVWLVERAFELELMPALGS